MKTILKRAEEKQTTPGQYTVYFYAKAMMQKWQGKIGDARLYMYKALEYAEQTENPMELAVAEHNVAEVEYWSGNYHVAKEFHRNSIRRFEQQKPDLEYEIKAYKDYAKTLASLKEYDDAICIVNKTLSMPGINEDIKAKLYLILSSVTEDPSYAKSIFAMDDVSNKVQQFSCRFLMDFYDKNNDPAEFLIYYKKSVQLSNTNTNVFQEEEF
jgi:tetratricopeptide (TPR) repeat protein